MSKFDPTYKDFDKQTKEERDYTRMVAEKALDAILEKYSRQPGIRGVFLKRCSEVYAEEQKAKTGKPSRDDLLAELLREATADKKKSSSDIF
jgi:hypothetical protein